MLKRLLLALLIACLAIPAAASPLASAAGQVEASTPCHGMPGDHGSPPAKQMTKHQCIGCVPPVSKIAPVGMPPALVGLSVPAFRPRHLLGSSIPPATPPPRA